MNGPKVERNVQLICCEVDFLVALPHSLDHTLLHYLTLFLFTISSYPSSPHLTILSLFPSSSPLKTKTVTFRRHVHLQEPGDRLLKKSATTLHEQRVDLSIMYVQYVVRSRKKIKFHTVHLRRTYVENNKVYLTVIYGLIGRIIVAEGSSRYWANN